jgi:1-acyl-sn-glycerol-3-phosphate acyltransferase
LQHTPPHQIFLTGATGFVGKVVLAELLRQREALGLGHVFVLIREKRGKLPQERFLSELANAPVFRNLPLDWTQHVTAIAGDLALPGAGLAPEDLARLQRSVTHVIHSAASIEFELPVDQAAAANITASLNVLELARGCAGLQRMVAVSTAYVTPCRPDGAPIPEALVDLPFSPQAVYEDILAGRADGAALMRATGHANTYTLTKCIAEHLLAARRGGVPLSIVRPSIISATLRHPFPGWIDSPAAMGAFALLAGSGRLRAVIGKRDSRLDVVPCDVVSDGLIEEAFSAGAFRIRHAVAGLAHNITFGQVMACSAAYFGPRPVDRAPRVHHIGPPGLSFAWAQFLHHQAPTALTMLGLRLVGRADLARRLGRLASKVDYLNQAFPTFTQNAFNFVVAKPAPLDDFVAEPYMALVCEGLYRHYLKRDPEARPLGGRGFKDGHPSDLAWALSRPHGAPAIRFLAWGIRKAARRCVDRLTYSHEALERAHAAVPEGANVVLVPSHRSYMDFLLCSFLFFARPELGVRIPYIAAAEEFAAIPLIGKLFAAAQAFYLRRGLHREDPALTRQVQALSARGEVIEFFIEGARSRSRRFLAPRTGLLRCLQATGRPTALVPIAIMYDRVPEEAALHRELAGAPQSRMRLKSFLAWAGRLLRGEIALGRIHLAAAAPVVMAPDDDVHAVAGAVMAGLQSQMGVSTFHLRCFLRHAALPDVELGWLRAMLERCGALVIDSDLKGDEAVDSATELNYRQQWLTWLYPEALALWPDHPLLAAEVQARPWLAPRPALAPLDLRTIRLVQAAFRPWLQDVAIVLERLGTPEWAPRYGTPGAMVPELPQVSPLHIHAAFEALVTLGVLVRDSESRTHAWGPNRERMTALRTACRAMAESDGPPNILTVPAAVEVQA